MFGMVFGCILMVVVPAWFLVSLILAIVRKSKGWMVSAIIAGVATLLLVGVTVAGAVASGVKAAKEQALPRQFTTTDGLASVEGPGTWSHLDMDSPEATLKVGNMVAEEYLIVISEPKADFPEGFGLPEYTEIVSNQIFENFDDATAEDAVRLEISGRPAFRRELKGKSDGIGIFYIVHAVEGEEHYHQILTWTLLERGDAKREKLQAAADSFRETGAEPGDAQ